MNYAKPYMKEADLNNPELIPIFSEYRRIDFDTSRGITFNELRNLLDEIEKEAIEDGHFDLEIWEEEYYGDGYSPQYENPTKSIHVYTRHTENERERKERLNKYKTDKDIAAKRKKDQDEGDRREFERLNKIFNKDEGS